PPPLSNPPPLPYTTLFRSKLFFPCFGRDTNLMFHFGITYRHKMPRLQVCSARRRPRGTNAMFDHFARHRSIGKVADRSPSFHHRSEEHTFELQSRGHLVCR